MAHIERYEQSGMHRLIPAKAGASVLEELSLPNAVIADLSELDALTNERKIAEHNLSPKISQCELLCGVPEASVVNAAFTHQRPEGGRFNDSRRGAWYAAEELETSIQEVRFHRQRFLRDGRIYGEFSYAYRDFLADFAGDYHFLDNEEKEICLQPEPVPECYQSSQKLARDLLYKRSNGIIYPSVRDSNGMCIACFRPALVNHPRRGEIYEVEVTVIA